MHSKIIISIIIEQIFVIFILVLHLSGFMNVSTNTPSSSSGTNLSTSQIESLIESSESFQADEKLSVKTVLLVIDALRVDHLVSVEKPLMSYSSQLMKTGHGVGYLIKTASPTVTLPRIKSIITGSIPKFMDVIFNFASKEILDENVITSSYRKGMKVNFYGDEIWVKLFPKGFHQKESVTSFYVSDYTEVDRNITRNLPQLFKKDDWDFLILHYLGLDHIGHLEGPKSSLIAPKLQEMDSVIKKVHKYLQDKKEPYLFVICGDHGMSDIGGHGGDSHAEIWTSALVISHLIDPDLSSSYSSPPQRIRSQVDFASTLALHLGVPIPVKNIGVPLYELLEVLPVEKQMSAHYRVSKQLMHLAMGTQEEVNIAEASKLYSRAVKNHLSAWQKKTSSVSSPTNEALMSVNQYKEFEILISSILTENMESYDLPLLLFSSLVLIMVSLPTIIWTLFISSDLTSPIYEWKMFLLSLVGALVLGVMRSFSIPTITPSSYVVFVLFMYGACNLLSFVNCFSTKFELQVSEWAPIKFLIVFGVLMHPFSLLSTSFVEEEHYEFYFFTSILYFTFLGVLSIKMVKYRSKGETSSENLHTYADTKLVNYPLDDPILFKAERDFYFYLNGKKENGIILHSDNRFNRYFSLSLFTLFGWMLFRLLRAFNATGDKWKDMIHLNDLLRETEGNELYFCILFGLSLVFLLYRSYCPGLLAICELGILGKNFPFINRGLQSGVLESQFTYMAIIFYIMYNVTKITYYNLVLLKHNIYDHELGVVSLLRFLLQISEAAFALLFLLLQKPENVLVSALCILHNHLLIPVLLQHYKIFHLSKIQVYVIAFWIGYAHYFIQGNSNSLSTIQINSGFVGLTSYQPVVHGFLIVCHTFGARFLTFLHTLVCVTFFNDKIQSLIDCLRTWWMLQLLTLTVYVINVTLQRHHLFIWSVFAPKLLYEESHFLCLTVLTILTFILYKVAKIISH